MTEPVEKIGPGRRRERDTIGAMLRIYCHDHHGKGRGLCPDCSDVLAYSERRLEKCLFGDVKPTCARCPVHCYQPAMRTRVKDVMRYAGPRMIYRHPILAMRHILHGRREAPQDPRRRESADTCCAGAPETAPDTMRRDGP